MEFQPEVCVVGGCGHVGLPLAIALAARGLSVAIHDINREAVDQVNAGVMPFREEGADELLEQVAGRTLVAGHDPAFISSSRYVIVIIGTPVDEHLNPRYTALHRFINELVQHLVDGQVVILRSTLYPGTSEKLAALIAATGKKVHVSFCPERIAEGKALRELAELPQIVSGFDPEAVAEATTLFRHLTDEILVLDPLEAELAKLFTNVWRYIQFAISNQFYMITQQYNLDFYRIHHAMRHNYPRTQGFMGAGLTAGPCLFKDTMQLASFNNNNFFLGHAAMLINEGLPNFIVNELKARHPLRERVVGILGMAFKGDSDDPRDSLSYKLKKILEFEAAQVLCSDPHVGDTGLVSVDQLQQCCDIIILAAPHREYRDLEFPPRITLVDIWNFYGRGGLIK